MRECRVSFMMYRAGLTPAFEQHVRPSWYSADLGQPATKRGISDQDAKGYELLLLALVGSGIGE